MLRPRGHSQQEAATHAWECTYARAEVTVAGSTPSIKMNNSSSPELEKKNIFSHLPLSYINNADCFGFICPSFFKASEISAAAK